MNISLPLGALFSISILFQYMFIKIKLFFPIFNVKQM